MSGRFGSPALTAEYISSDQPGRDHGDRDPESYGMVSIDSFTADSYTAPYFIRAKTAWLWQQATSMCPGTGR
jgi:hypothetical protein